MLGCLLVLSVAGCGGTGGGEGPGAISHGPWVGHLASDAAFVWVRGTGEGSGTAVLSPAVAADAAVGDRRSSRAVRLERERDGCAVVRFEGLAAATDYVCEVRYGDGGPRTVAFRTPAAPEAAQRVRLAVGSCARETPGVWNPVFPAIAARNPDALLLIGDTPYIDSVKLGVQRRRYAEFFSDPGLAALRAGTATYAVWDDHDFGLNDSDGSLDGKKDSRRAFDEWHANASVGLDDDGVNSSFRRGPVEVFLIDARWWSRKPKDKNDTEDGKLLGKRQRAWLEAGLLASRAPFKLLVTGMVWNDSVPAGKTDYWGGYPHERAALFRFVAERGVTGVVLVSGDVHRSRAFRNPPEATGVPYPLYEFVSSPLGPNVHAKAEVGGPHLVFDRGEPHAFLEIDAESFGDGRPAALSARHLDRYGSVMFEAKTTAADLK